MQTDKLNNSFASFSSLVDKWKERGKIIRSTEELILCYYDTFKVVCIPSLMTAPTRVIIGQFEKLYSEIQRASEAVGARREAVGNKMDVESFSFHTQHAFELFSKSLDDAFNFHYVSDKIAVIPEDFADRLVVLLAKLMNQYTASMETIVGQEAAMLDSFVPYLASCLALEYAERIKGLHKLNLPSLMTSLRRFLLSR